MFSLFPALLSFSFFAPFLLRLAAGGVFIAEGLTHIGRGRDNAARSFENAGMLPTFGIVFSLSELAAGVLLLAGLFTQAAALLGIILALSLAGFARKGHAIASSGFSFYLLLSLVCISLTLTGAGAFAFDLPL